MNKIQELEKQGLIHPPSWLSANVMYLTIMGSTAYGVSTDESDFDVYGFCVPRKDLVFPHLAGEIPGFGKQVKRFEQYQEHHIWAQQELGGKGRNYDIAVYSIVKFFQLCMDNNPNMVDALFTPARCVLTRTPVWELVRQNRQLFLHKGCFHKFRGYAYAQLHKMKSKNSEGKRKALVEKFGYDVKFAYHVVRLSLECEQILEECTLDLERNREILKSVRRGEWSIEQIEDWFAQKEGHLDNLYHSSPLPHSPNEDAIKALLLDCLSMHYGSLGNMITLPDRYEKAVRQIQSIIENI